MIEEERIVPKGQQPTASVSAGLAMTGDKPRTLEMVAAEIRAYTWSMLVNIVEIGRRLTEAKAMLKHGEFTNWCTENFGYSKSQTNNFMRLYEAYGAEQNSLFGAELNRQTFGSLTYSKALALLAIPSLEERETFVVENNVEEMTTRELKQALKEKADAEAKARQWEDKAGEYASQINDLQNDVQDALKQRNDEEQARADAEEQLRRIKAELDEIEKRPQAVVYERDEEAIAKAANDAADAEREKHEKAEKELKEQIAALTGQVKTESGNRKKLEKQLHEAEEKVAAAKKDGAEAEELRGQIEGLKKQLAMAAPEVAEFKAAFERVQREFSAMLETLDRIQDGETKGKLRAACAAVLDGFMGRVKE